MKARTRMHAKDERLLVSMGVKRDARKLVKKSKSAGRKTSQRGSRRATSSKRVGRARSKA